MLADRLKLLSYTPPSVEGIGLKRGLASNKGVEMSFITPLCEWRPLGYSTHWPDGRVKICANSSHMCCYLACQNSSSESPWELSECCPTARYQGRRRYPGGVNRGPSISRDCGIVQNWWGVFTVRRKDMTIIALQDGFETCAGQAPLMAR